MWKLVILTVCFLVLDANAMQVPCGSFDCENDGTCSYTFGQGFQCTCTPDFSGPHCTEPVDVCGPNFFNCNRLAKCVPKHSDPKGFTCICPPGYSGDLCYYSDHVCDYSICPDGLKCIPDESNDLGFTCDWSQENVKRFKSQVKPIRTPKRV